MWKRWRANSKKCKVAPKMLQLKALSRIRWEVMLKMLTVWTISNSSAKNGIRKIATSYMKIGTATCRKFPGDFKCPVKYKNLRARQSSQWKAKIKQKENLFSRKRRQGEIRVFGKKWYETFPEVLLLNSISSRKLEYKPITNPKSHSVQHVRRWNFG